jgi:hypothetical protein
MALGKGHDAGQFTAIKRLPHGAQSSRAALRGSVRLQKESECPSQVGIARSPRRLASVRGHRAAEVGHRSWNLSLLCQMENGSNHRGHVGPDALESPRWLRRAPVALPRVIPKTPTRVARRGHQLPTALVRMSAIPRW